MLGYKGWYGQTFSPEGRTIETDAFTCKHCQKIVPIKPMCDPADMGGRCFQCDALICSDCVGKGCMPFEKKLEQMERRAKLFQSMNE